MGGRTELMSSSSPAADAAAIVRKSRSNLAFALASLPRERREDMYAFYAFCRLVDDLADDEGIALEERRVGLERWRAVIHERAAGMSAFEESIVALRDRYHVPVRELEEIIEGVSMDLEPRRFADWEALRVYCWRVACCVGLVSIRIFGCRRPESRDYAVHLGYALQVTNILRDIRGDWENGQRLYLPLDEMAACGVSEEDIAARRYSDGFFELMRRQIARAREHYAGAVMAWRREDEAPLLASETMRRIYSGTLDLMEADGCRVFDRRYSLPTRTKVRHVGAAWLRGLALRIFR